MSLTINQFASLLGRKFGVAAILAFTLALAGCNSSGSVTSGYYGPSVSSFAAKRDNARKSIRKAKKDLKVAKRDLRKLEKTIKKNERLLKRKKLSKKRTAEAKKDLRAAKWDLRSAKWAVSRAERSLKSARNSEKSAITGMATAKKRQAEAEKRRAEIERRRDEAKKDAEKRKQVADARNQLKAKKSETKTEVSKSKVFGFGDPALKNIDDYQARVDGGFALPAIPVKSMDKRLLRQVVSYSTSHKVGTLVVDTSARFLYLVQSGGKALRYGIGVGKAGFAWSGEAHVGWKQEWPKWTPPEEMIARRPELAKYCADCGGMPGGIDNPLGARALYLMQGNVDTLFRLHGTPQWKSIGTAASSGCIRLINQDIIDLYKRVPHGTKVVVI